MSSLVSGDYLVGCCKAVMRSLAAAAAMSVDAAVGSRCLLGNQSTVSEFLDAIVSITQNF